MIYTGAVALYAALLIVVSITRSRRVKNQDDFMVAGRQVSTVFLVGTLVCTWIGSGSLFGGAGRAFREGFSALWMSAGAWAGLIVVYFLAPRVRRIAEYTVSDILERRYNQWARLFGSVAIVIAYLTIASYQFNGGGRLLNLLTGMDVLHGKLITCALAVVFTMTAGMISIVALDILNGTFITLGILVALPLIYHEAGGWQQITAHLSPEHFTVFGRPGVLPAIGLFMPTFFLLLGESSMYQKFFSAKDEKAARRAVVGMVIGVIIIEVALATVAIFGGSLHTQDPAFVRPDGTFIKAATETIILQVARTHLPVVAGLILLCAAAAIIFSTANTFLMVPSTNIARDIYQRFINPNVSQKRIVTFQRVLIPILAAVAFVVSSFFQSILDMALYAYTMVGAAVTPALLAAFLWKRVTVVGGVTSVVAGMVTTMIFGALNSLGVISWDYDYIIYPAGGASILALVLVSLLSAPSPEEKWRPFWTSTEQERVGIHASG
ncbi:MAG: sodium:solute symporter family protein [Acidobacteriota bacterium]|nr:sodium:solute symporter family protein [Blastocatellia bacterium]MDW8239696.1 sodium:solute symporter family protein [Acidobacteriota bacterium]